MDSSLQNKVAVVTGASSGIGKATALELAKAGAKVVMVCRKSSKADLAYQELVKQVGNDHVELMTADLASQASIRQWVELFKSTHSRLDILVNNAGVYIPKREVTVDGFEKTFATNHLGYFLVTNLLLDLLKASAPSRIVSVASAAQRFATINFDDLQTESRYSGMKAYSQSKLANIIFTYELSRRLQGTSVTANCLHPGVVNTGWGKSSKGLFKIAMNLFSLFLISPAKGAQTSVYLATSPDISGVSGKYFVKCKQEKSIEESYDLDIAKKLWDISESLTKIS